MGSECRFEDIANNKCVGGLSRIKTVIDAYRANTSNLLLLDAGDQFQGTLFFNIFGGAASAEMMNAFEYDLMTIGNHEFDRGVSYLGDFISNLTFPVVNSNIDLATAPPLAKAGVKPYAIFPKYNLGIIGFITNTTGFITKSASNVTFQNPVEPVQAAIDELHSKGIKRIICLSHNGYKDDQYLAQNTRGISIIVGGHSHSLLLKDQTVPGVVGPYPTQVTNLDGQDTWVVQAHRFGDYVGHVDLEWNSKNELVSLSGDPILLDESIGKDAVVQHRVDQLRKAFSHLTENVLAYTPGDFDMAACKKGPGFECALGNLVADALLDAEKANGVNIGMTNAGGLRSSFSAGNITAADVMTVLPFNNPAAIFSMTGKEIMVVLERVFAQRDQETGRPVISPPQWSGLKVKFDSRKPLYSRVSSVSVQGQDLVLDKTYKIVTNDFVAGGGDGILRPLEFTEGDEMSDIVIRYLKRLGRVEPFTEDRIVDLAAHKGY